MENTIQQLIADWRCFIASRMSEKKRIHVFNQIWDHYHKRLFFFVREFAYDDAEDLMQEIMIKVYANLEKYNPVYSFNTWIYTIARNHSLNYITKKSTVNNRNMTSLETGIPLQSDFRSDQHVLTDELSSIIDSFLETLDPTHRQIAYLRFFEEMKMGQIAKTLSLPLGTVKSRLHLIKQSLKKELEIA